MIVKLILKMKVNFEVDRIEFERLKLEKKKAGNLRG